MPGDASDKQNAPPSEYQEASDDWRFRLAKWWKDRVPNPITFFTFLLVIIGALQLRTYMQANEIMKADQRAWVGINEIELADPPRVKELLVLAVGYANFGKEPAKNVNFDRTDSFTATIPSNVPPELVPRFDSECNIDGSDPEGRATGETCKARIEKNLAQCRYTNSTPPGRVVFPGKGSFPLPVSEGAMRGNINTKERVIVLTGCVTYLTFEQVHYSSFCYFYRGGQTPPKTMKPCPIGNDAN
ncbi:hypothetical protein UNPF46_29585 [Bradyrhizobium sp. UNPF46]|uniref:hypothetical protein n=1 Tax=Bradyrhizobium sp. UNPF46 TaxID=1141168 RepID=UPI0011534DC4|nr:hypothetical protein [Bradyrhizobium sp. UNPF46]TQF27714.1 hypothetical protein UNPF46_29585 [Bradyrhizobium sp. UNPF46]